MFANLMTRWRLKKLIRNWLEYREMIAHFRGVTEVSPEQESAFLQLKARIATLLPVLTASPPPSIAQEANSHSRAITDLLNRHRNLKSNGPPNGPEREDFERRWHEHWVFLNKMRGVRATPIKTAIPTGRMPVPTGMPMSRRSRSGPIGWAFRFVFRVVVLVGALYFLGRLFGVRFAEGGAWVADPPKNLGGVTGAIRLFGQTIAQGIAEFVSPVTSSYGVEATLVLFGILALSLGYWFFIRK